MSTAFVLDSGGPLPAVFHHQHSGLSVSLSHLGEHYSHQLPENTPKWLASEIKPYQSENYSDGYNISVLTTEKTPRDLV